MPNKNTVSSNNITRRDFSKGALATAFFTTLGMPSNVMADDTPPAFRPDYLFNGEDTDEFVANRSFNTQKVAKNIFHQLKNNRGNLRQIKTLLTGQDPINSHQSVFSDNFIYCDTFQLFILINKVPDRAGIVTLPTFKYRELENKYYHKYCTLMGICDFFREHLGKSGKPTKEGSKVWFARGIFASMEDNPKDGEALGDKYVKASLDDKEEMITQYLVPKITERLSNISSEYKAERNPLNNGERCKSAQESAFILTQKYRLLEKYENYSSRHGNIIEKNIEDLIKSILLETRGPPSYT